MGRVQRTHVARADRLQVTYQARQVHRRVTRYQQVHVVRLTVKLLQLAAPAAAHPFHLDFHLAEHLGRQAGMPVLRHKDDVEL